MRSERCFFAPFVAQLLTEFDRPRAQISLESKVSKDDVKAFGEVADSGTADKVPRLTCETESADCRVRALRLICIRYHFLPFDVAWTTVLGASVREILRSFSIQVHQGLSWCKSVVDSDPSVLFFFLNSSGFQFHNACFHSN